MKLDDLFGDVFQLLLKSETREKYPALNEYFTKKGKNHALGTTRIGDQIDLIPVSSQVARDSDIARNLNAGVKKKESQRQREKRMKEKSKKNDLKKIKNIQFTAEKKNRLMQMRKFCLIKTIWQKGMNILRSVVYQLAPITHGWHTV